ncbi:MAG TPA: helix-turn-helix transcriptional regulator [Syntrophorhabdales bacterium]|nr:helix-turn-helix transcriptional regulator [Syntrophorhabdales bacterium]
MSLPANKDLGALANEDLQDIFNIIHSANCHVSLSEMRTEVLGCLRKAFRAEGAVFFLGDRELRAIDNDSMTGVGINPGYHERWVRYYSHHDPFQQGRSPAAHAVCKVDDILPYKRWMNLRIYNEFYKPQNIHYKLSLYLRSSEKILGLIGMFRSKEQRDFSQSDLAKARILVPHLTAAVDNALRFKELMSTTHDLKEYHLTKREIDVIRCVCQGLTNDEIGKRLYISRFTVETHLKNVFDKTGVKHRAGLAGLLPSL